MTAPLHLHHRKIFYACWIILSFIQSAFTELQDDEAYYWVYGRFLDWGYFDHPPMIGLLVKLGSSLLPGELGVRLFPLILNILSLFIIERLTDRKNPFLFYAILLSIAVLQLSGFVAVPDNPLIFFTAVFFLCFKNFIAKPTLVNTLLLGFSIALLFYSKYHAVLVVLLAFLSQPRLFLRYQSYVAAVFALLLFAPHLVWQYQHDWVSFRYHLFESNVNAYKFSFTGDYLIGQILLAGPLAGIILLPAAILFKPKDGLMKALKFTMIGIYIFFLLSSFRGKVEGNWTSPALVPLIVLSHQYLSEKQNWQKWLFRLLPITLILVIAARIIMIVDIIPSTEIKKRYHSWKNWPEDLRSKTNDMPVVFSNSYQRASKYWFYTGQTTYSQNWYRERKNNFNFWAIEVSLLSKPVYFMDIYQVHRFSDTMKTPIGVIGYSHDPYFYSFAKIQFLAEARKYKLRVEDSFRVAGKVQRPLHYVNFLSRFQVPNDTLRVGFFSNKGWIKDVFTNYRVNTVSDSFNFIINPGLPKGKYYMRFSINVGRYNPTHNSDKIELEIN